jgi:hypothetical protein
VLFIKCTGDAHVQRPAVQLLIRGDAIGVRRRVQAAQKSTPMVTITPGNVEYGEDNEDTAH